MLLSHLLVEIVAPSVPNFMNGNLAGSPLKIHIYVEFNLEYVSFVSPKLF